MAAWAVGRDETMNREKKGEMRIEIETRYREQKRSAQMIGASTLFRGLKHLHDGFNSLHTETTLGITNV